MYLAINVLTGSMKLNFIASFLFGCWCPFDWSSSLQKVWLVWNFLVGLFTRLWMVGFSLLFAFIPSQFTCLYFEYVFTEWVHGIDFDGDNWWCSYFWWYCGGIAAFYLLYFCMFLCIECVISFWTRFIDYDKGWRRFAFYFSVMSFSEMDHY